VFKAENYHTLTFTFSSEMIPSGRAYTLSLRLNPLLKADYEYPNGFSVLLLEALACVV